MFQRVTS